MTEIYYAKEYGEYQDFDIKIGPPCTTMELLMPMIQARLESSAENGMVFMEEDAPHAVHADEHLEDERGRSYSSECVRSWLHQGEHAKTWIVVIRCQVRDQP